MSEDSFKMGNFPVRVNYMKDHVLYNSLFSHSHSEMARYNYHVVLQYMVINNKWILNMASEWPCVSPYSSKKFNVLAAVWFKPTPWEDKLGNTYLLFTYNNNCKTFKSCCRCTHAVLKGKVLPCCTIKILINSNLKISLYCQNSLTTAVWSFLTHLICIPYSVYRGPLLFHDGLATANGC